MINVTSMKRAITAVSILALLALALTSCDAITNGAGSCEVYSDEFLDSLVDEGKLSQGVSEEGPYPMALVVSQDALNRLLAAVLDNELPAVELFDDLLGLPISLTLRPELPLIQVGGELGCAECLLSELGFGIDVGFDGATTSGRGAGRFQFPLGLTPNGLDSTTVFARMAESALIEIDLDLGLDSTLMNAVEPLIARAATIAVTQTIGDTELFEMGHWSIGDGDVRMLARGPVIDGDAGTVVLGVHTNLVRPLDGTVALDTSLPDGVDLGMQFHPELIQTMVQRMMFEGHIERDYNELGQASDGANHKVSLNFMDAGDTDLLRTNFTLWRTGGGLCGFADLQADLGLSISDREIAMAVDNVSVQDGGGVGELLVAADDWVSSGFLDGVTDFSELTVNYRELSLPNDQLADLSAESFRLDLDGRGLNIFLNIDAIVGSDQEP